MGSRRWLNLGLSVLGSELVLILGLVCSGANESSVALADTIAQHEIVESFSRVQSEHFAQMVGADVVYLGERHDSAADHKAQLSLIQALYSENQDLAIAMEMFQRPFQPVLDRYLAGEISETELIEQSEYEQRWGFPWEYYAPILQFAQTHNIPVIALNAPAEITRQVAQEGLDSLSGDDFQNIPPLTEIDTGNEAYQEFVRAAFGGHGSHGRFNFDNFFAAQVIWDETMAMSIANFKADNPDAQVVVLAGQGHVIYGYGIPSRVARRLGTGLNQQIVLLNPAPSVVETAAVGNEPGAIADIIWQSE
ncbi:MAG: ChaN family lipoprotein [Cyanobacteria bacterium P01_D01_bin.128]